MEKEEYYRILREENVPEHLIENLWIVASRNTLNYETLIVDNFLPNTKSLGSAEVLQKYSFFFQTICLAKHRG